MALATACADAMWRSDLASRSLGMELESVTPGHARLSMRVRPDMANGHGLCHGGLVAALADSAFAFACDGRGTVTVASGFDVELLESAGVGDGWSPTPARWRSAVGRVSTTSPSGAVRRWSRSSVAAAGRSGDPSWRRNDDR